jgi:hypothetical protein
MGWFGDQGSGSSGNMITCNTIMGGVFTFNGGAGQVANSISALIKQGGDNAYTHHMKCALYKHSDSSLVAYTEELTVTDMTSAFVWYTFNFTSPPALIDGTDYIIVTWSDTATEGQYNVLLGNENQAPNLGHYESLAYGAFPDPFSESGTAVRDFCIYCTYSPASTAQCLGTFLK